MSVHIVNFDLAANASPHFRRQALRWPKLDLRCQNTHRDHDPQDTGRRVAKMFITEVFGLREMIRSDTG